MKRSEAPRRSGKVVNAYAKDDGTLVQFFRDADGQLVRRSEPYRGVCFFKKRDLSEEMYRELRGEAIVHAVRDDGDFYRVEWNDREALKRLTRKGGLFDQRELKTYEADVRSVRRWLTDNPGLQIDRPRRCYLDLEGDSELPFAQKHLGRILAWAVVDDDGNAKSGVLRRDDDSAERQVLLDMWRALSAFDQIVAWNGERYDFDLMEARTVHCGIDVEYRRWLWLDHLVLFRRMNVTASESGEEKQSFGLDAVAKVILGEGKMELDDDELEGLDDDVGIGAQASEVWRRHPEKLGTYCVDDADKLRRIEAKTGYLEILQAVCEACVTFPDTWGINPTVQVEGFLMRLGAAKGMRFRTHQYDENAKGFKGADVLHVERGLHATEVHVVDFARMYPSIIISWNISPETWRPDVRLTEDTSTRPSYLSHLPIRKFPIPPGHCAAATEAVFRNEPMGILPEALVEILDQRKKWSKREAQCSPGTPEWQEAHRRAISYKQIANCFYGVISSPLSRFYERAVGEAITRTGAWLLHAVTDAVKERGFKTVLADTDSNGFRGATREQAHELVKYCNTELFPKLIAEKQAPRNELRIEYEKAFARICILVKKRYFAKWAHYKGSEARVDSRPEVKGLEYKRGDSCRLTRAMQKEIIDAILGFDEQLVHAVEEVAEADDAAHVCAYLLATTKHPPPVDSPAELERIVRRYETMLFDQPIVLEDVVQSKKLAKRIDEYSQKEKKAPPPAKMRGESVSIIYSDHDCPTCGAAPAQMLELVQGKCPCGAPWRKRKSSTKGMVLRADGERVWVCDGRRSMLVWNMTIDTAVAFKTPPVHVQIAKQLQLRGRDVGRGVRIEFVVVDEDDPFGTIPAEDFDGEIDRHAMWNTIWTPTKRVLEAAFPSYSWSMFERLKPQQARAQAVRVQRAAAKKRDGETKQGALF